MNQNQTNASEEQDEYDDDQSFLGGSVRQIRRKNPLF